MPIYEVKCKQCGVHHDIYRNLSEYQDLPECCGERMQRVISPSYVMEDIKPYRSVIDGSWITSRKQHKQHLSENGCVEVGNESLEQKPSYTEQKRDKEREREQRRVDISRTLSDYGL